ncbi:MAG TPA: hypothetical protein VI248_26295 [Kineosporiaceae bacterium]
MIVRRLGLTATTLGAAFSLMLGLSSPASAATVVYENSNANVKISGGEAVALNACIADAQDGVIQTQLVACQQIAAAGNLVTLEGVSVWVTSITTPARILYHGDQVDVSVSGGLAAAVNACVADAQDGVVQTQIVACHQVAAAGNLVNLSGVWVEVTQP